MRLKICKVAFLSLCCVTRVIFMAGLLHKEHIVLLYISLRVLDDVRRDDAATSPTPL
jgi:hypothetical protein